MTNDPVTFRLPQLEKDIKNLEKKFESVEKDLRSLQQLLEAGMI